MGYTQQMISEQVKQKAVSESESIYDSIYGTLGDIGLMGIDEAAQYT